MKVTYFFRKAMPDKYSIEGMFSNFQQELSQDIKCSNYFMRFKSKGILRRFMNCIDSIFHQGDINHITGDIHYIALFLQKNRTLLTIPDLETLMRGGWFRRMMIKLFWYYLPSRRVTRISVISETVKKELICNLKIDPTKIEVVPCCVSGALNYSPREFNQKCPVLLQIGTKENKNIPNLIQAIKDIPCKLIIVGRLSERCLDLLTKHKINYENDYDQTFAEIVHLYQKADLVTLISTYEGFGLPIIEANAIGRAVITSNLSSMPEVGGDAAFFVNPYSIQKIREGILRLIQDDQLRDQLIQNGLKNVQRFHPKIIANKYSELYHSIV